MAINNTNDYSGISGSQEYNLKKIGAFHMIGDDDYEPQRNNNFEVRIYGLNTDLQGAAVSSNREDANETGLKTIDKGIDIDENIASDCLTLSAVSVGAINTNVGPISIAYGNTKVKFAGLPEISDSTIVYNDYIGKATERVIAAWHGLVFNPKSQKIGRASQYKKRGLLIETAPDGTRARVWELQGCWPSSVSYGDYDYNGGQVRQINLTLTYDIAIPLDA